MELMIMKKTKELSAMVAFVCATGDEARIHATERVLQDQIDSIEKRIQEKIPQAKHMDLEAD